MTDPRDAWINQCEAYYRDRYPPVMRTKVFKILPTDDRRLTALMDIVIADPEAWKRTVKVPGVDAVKKALVEMYAAHPGLRVTAVDADNVVLLEDSSPIRDVQVAKGFAAFMLAFKSGKNPAKDSGVKAMLKELGYD